MGHYDMEREAVGKNRDDALGNARDDIMSEHGYSYNFREVTEEEFLGLVPPKKTIKRPVRSPWGEVMYNEIVSVDDESAPKSEWLEKWRFVMDYHV